MARSRRLIGSFDDECDLEYVPLGTHTPPPPTRVTRGTPKKVAPGVVISSQSDKERILTGTPYGSALGSNGAYGSEETYDS